MKLTIHTTRPRLEGKQAPTAQSREGLATRLLELFGSRLQQVFPAMGGRRPKRRMELLEILPLGGKRQLMLVSCDGRSYLVGGGTDAVQSIVELSAGAVTGGPLPYAVTNRCDLWAMPDCTTPGVERAQ